MVQGGKAMTRMTMVVVAVTTVLVLLWVASGAAH
jgi:hypothetical protein